MNKREKYLMYFMVAIFLVLIVKSFVLDPYAPKNSNEEAFYEQVEGIMEDKYTGFLYENKIVYPRIVSISEMSEKERTVKDKEGNTYIADGIYKAKIRKYILGFLPFAEERLLDID